MYMYIRIGARKDANEQAELRAALERAKQHPTFPVLDYIARKTNSQNETLVSLDKRLSRIETELAKFKEQQDDMKDLVKEESQKRFQIKGSVYEVREASG